MADIFISYSSKDREKAEQLTELLASAGLSVWIDKSGLDVSTSWSAEIVDAITSCSAFIVLLSTNSIESHNVIKEVSLASEKRKKILPLDLEPITLPRELEYQLAGIHRAPMTNIDSIIRALGKLGLEATQAPTMKLVKETDGRKSLMILPFEDLSPTGDNAWFADGIATELIGALAHVKTLRVADQHATKDYKRYQGSLPHYAKETAIRYFVQGSVRKFGDQIKIAVSLLDIESGDHLWQDSLKGTMDDIFDIQEKVAEKVVEGLKIHLGPDEKAKLADRGTENAEAYELFIKGVEYFDRNTKEGFQLALQLFSEAITLDAGYARGYQYKALSLTALYRNYEQNPVLLDEALTLCTKALRLQPDLFAIYYPLSMVYTYRGQLSEAEEAAREYIRNDPQNPNSHFTLGFFYDNAGQSENAITPYEEAVRLLPDNLTSLWNLVVVCDSSHEREKCRHWSETALPHLERYLKLHPDDENRRVWQAILLFLSDKVDEAHATTMKLTELRDGLSLFNTAQLFARLDDRPEALRTFRKAIGAGFRNLGLLNSFLYNEEGGIAKLKGTPEYEEVKRMVEKIDEEAKANV